MFESLPRCCASVNGAVITTQLSGPVDSVNVGQALQSIFHCKHHLDLILQRRSLCLSLSAQHLHKLSISFIQCYMLILWSFLCAVCLFFVGFAAGFYIRICPLLAWILEAIAGKERHWRQAVLLAFKPLIGAAPYHPADFPLPAAGSCISRIFLWEQVHTASSSNWLPNQYEDHAVKKAMWLNVLYFHESWVVPFLWQWNKAIINKC